MNISIKQSGPQTSNLRKAIASVNPEAVNNSAVSTGANRDSGPGSFNSNFGFSLFGQTTLNKNNFGTEYARTDSQGAQNYATQGVTDANPEKNAILVAWNNAASATKTKALNADPTSPDYQVNPNTFDKFDPLEYYGQNRFGINGAGGNGFDLERAKRFDIPDTNPPQDSKLFGLLPTDLATTSQVNQLWNDIRKNLVAGPDGKGLFANDEFLNKALNETIDKFKSGPNGLDHGLKNAITNNDVLSTVTAFKISNEGIHKNGLGKLYEAYAKVDNVLPDNIINRNFLNSFNASLQKNGDVVSALADAKKFDNKTYGFLDVETEEVKSFGNKINQAAFKSMAESLKLDANKLEQTLKEKGGIDGENKFYDISGAMALASAQDFSLLSKDADGKTGFEKLVEKSERREDDKNHEAHVNFHIRPKGDANTDGTAFLDFSQNGIEALASLQKHVGGLNENPMLANQFSFVFQDEKNFKEWAPKILEEMKKANIDVTKLGINVEGHGSKESGAMIKSGVVGADYQGIGQDDSQFMAGLLEKTEKVRQVDVKYDSCFGLHPATHNAEAINAKAKALGMNIAVTFEGSNKEGLVKSQQGAETNNQDRFNRNADGTYSAGNQRKDGGGTDEAGVLYSRDKESFNAEMEKVKAESNESNKKALDV